MKLDWFERGDETASSSVYRRGDRQVSIVKRVRTFPCRREVYRWVRIEDDVRENQYLFTMDVPADFHVVWATRKDLATTIVNSLTMPTDIIKQLFVVLYGVDIVGPLEF